MYCNIACYKFVTFSIDELPPLCKKLKQLGTQHSLKGTILLGTEGINLFLAGEQVGIDEFIQTISSIPKLDNLPYKYSYSNFIPFKKLFVKLRREIVTFNQEEIRPEEFTAPYITPTELKSWLEDQKDFILLDTRNLFEYEIGSFEHAIHLNLHNFREFPEAINQTNKLNPERPIVSFCTGGIRCEKAAAYLLKHGFQQVYQLQGGILNYFEQCGDAFFQGNCFVFDDRIALNGKLEPADSNKR